MSEGRRRAERLLVRLASPPALSRLAGLAADLRLPGPLLRLAIRAYVRAYSVDLSEAAAPLQAFATFNEFFTRRLRASARPVDAAPDVVVSPSDSRLQSLGTMPADGRLEQIKGIRYTLEALLGDAGEAARFAAGVHATLYLSPSMYHRVHAPVDGRIVRWRSIPGRLYPVNAPAVRQVDGLFTVNERVVVRVESDRFGPVAVVMVGATNVGRISLAFADHVTNSGRGARDVVPQPSIPVARGAELGAFNLGSTVVLLVADPGLEPASARVGELVKMGQALWRRAQPR
jgi:phosphatidylserine decarboxylase